MKKLFLFIMAICSIAIMMYFSSRNAEISSHQSDIVLNILRSFGLEFNIHFIRKFAHFIIFVLIGFCVSMFIGNCIENNTIATLLSITLSSSYACVDEYIQTFIPGRSGNIGDIMIDVSGVLIGVLLYKMISYFMRNN